MSLNRPTVPKHVRQAFSAGLGDFVSSGGPLWSLLLNKNIATQAYNLRHHPFCPPQPGTSSPPYSSPPTGGSAGICDDTNSPCYVGCLQTLPDSMLQPTGWRFLAAEGDLYGACHVGTVGSAEPPPPPKLTGFSKAVQVLTAIESYNELPTIALPPNLPGDFEIRVLRITWLHLEAFWLYWLPLNSNGSTNTPCANNPQRGYDVIVPYFGFVKGLSIPATYPPDPQCLAGELSLMTAYLLPCFLLAICPRAKALCKKSADHQASIQQAQAAALESQASALAQQAKAVAATAARARVRHNINYATAEQIETTLGLTIAEAEAIVKYSQAHKGIHSWEELLKVQGVNPNDLKGKEALVGFGQP